MSCMVWNHNSSLGSVSRGGRNTIQRHHAARPVAPNIKKLTREPMQVLYLENPPEVIHIDISRQLFVDDFLVEARRDRIARTIANLSKL